MNAAVISRIEEANEENAPVRPALSATELLARRQAVDFARANVELEGFKVSPEDNALAERYASGEFDFDEYLAMQGLEPSVYRI
ncbi:MAG: antitoxin VbhA family protein [Candidatus Accumulibacter sp.]|jgi:hypothetical protein|nr:antitoxin VbhA family protein [Accumulibacter sp.]MDR1277018.1 antitoxin VbhA family protein [Accumulibacter sp.]